MMKNFSNFIQLAIYILILGLGSCVKINDNENDKNTIYGSGVIVSENLTLESFSKINLTGQAKITVIQGDTQSVAIRAQQNILDILDVHVSGNNLFIGVKNNYNISTQQGIFIDIVSPNPITDVSIVGSGDLTITGASQENLNATITGAGNIYAYNLEVDNCSIIITGTGNGCVKVNKSLNIVISGAGSVTYKGHPSISQVISGVGTIKDGN